MDKSEVKRAYKEAKHPMGVYAIRNSHNDTVFVGVATDLPARINRHKAELKFGNHRNRALQELWNAFGGSTFEFEILDELKHQESTKADPKKELRVLADMWMQKLQSTTESVVYLD